MLPRGEYSSYEIPFSLHSKIHSAAEASPAYRRRAFKMPVSNPHPGHQAKVASSPRDSTQDFVSSTSAAADGRGLAPGPLCSLEPHPALPETSPGTGAWLWRSGSSANTTRGRRAPCPPASAAGMCRTPASACSRPAGTTPPSPRCTPCPPPAAAGGDCPLPPSRGTRRRACWGTPGGGGGMLRPCGEPAPSAGGRHSPGQRLPRDSFRGAGAGLPAAVTAR